jgi:ribosomal protein S27AE
MAGVNPLVYVAAGAVVSITSLALGKEFTLFFYAGIAALIFGALSGFMGAMQYHGAKKAVEKGNQRTQQEVLRKYPDYAKQQMKMNAKYCNRCGMQSHLHANFCARCGFRV